ncbi:glycosyltransferase family 4 protein [Gammaproteobacteria bacterium]|nr:glycosyltransferase family 4 protein [Gammaproteobacteria bacterium]
MKIIYLHQYFKFPNEFGGTRSYDLSLGFLNLGHNVEVLTSTSDKGYKTNTRWSKVEKNGLVVHYIYLPYRNEMKYFHRLVVFFKFLWFSTFKLLSIKGDLVLATSTPLTIGIPALIKKWAHKTHFIFETRDVWPEVVIAIGAIKNKIVQNFLYSLEYLIYKNASAIVPLSVDMKKSIILRYPDLTSKPIEVIENISEIDRFQSGFSEKKSLLVEKIGFHPRFTVLYAGTFGHVNGISYVIDLADKLIHVDSTIIFILIGEGAEKGMIVQKANEKGVLNKNVFILDSISKEDLPQLYFECDMGSSFVIPVEELWANSANKFFDTLASGKPIMINHKGWQKKVINKENIGYVMPITLNDEEIKNFSIYSQNKPLIAKQQKNALNIAKERFATNIALSKYNKLFEEIFNY